MAGSAASKHRRPAFRPGKRGVPGWSLRFKPVLTDRDDDDWPVLAAAFRLASQIGTEDRQFFGTGVPVWTTGRALHIALHDTARINLERWLNLRTFQGVSDN